MAYGLLIVNKDSTCAKIVSKFLNVCDHRELHKGKLLDCLESIWSIRGKLEPVLFTNINRLVGVTGTQLVTKIRDLFELEIVQMTPDDNVIRFRRGRPINASAYVVSISSLDKMNLLWKVANETSTPELRPADLQATINRKMIEPQFKNLLLSTKEGSSSSKAIPMPSDSRAKRPRYHGLSLVVARGVGLGSKIQTLMYSSLASTSGTNLQSLSNPMSGVGSKIQTLMYSNGSHQNEVSSYCPPISSGCSTFDQDLDTVSKDTEARCPSTGDGTYGQESSLPDRAEDINAFLNGMGSSFWQGVYDHALRSK